MSGVTPCISVEVTDDPEAGDIALARPDDAAIGAWVQTALEVADVARDRPVDIAVLIAASETMRRMNNDYRGKDRPTNVLSFPVGDIAGLPGDAAVPLGDIVLCPEVIAREAAEQGKRPEDHWAHLCVHGALHLAGYDHVTAVEAAEMEALEVQILAGAGVSDPYAGN